MGFGIYKYSTCRRVRLAATSTKYARCCYPSLQLNLSLSLASLLVTIEEIVTVLLAGPVEIEGEDDEGGQERGEDETRIVESKGAGGAFRGHG